MKSGLLQYVVIVILCGFAFMQTLSSIAANKRAELWHSEAMKLSHDWQEVDAKNREAIENYRSAFKTCLVKLQK